MPQKTSVKVNSRYQVVLPSSARRQLNIEAGDRLLVDVQDGVLVMIPAPEDYVESLRGLHRKVWSEVDTKAYLTDERDAWTDSTRD